MVSLVRKTLAPKMRPSRHEMNRPCCLSALLIYPAVQSASAAGCSCNTTVTAQRWQMLDGIVYRLLARLVLTPAQEGNPNRGKIISMVDVLPVVTVHKEDIFQSRGNTAVLIVLQLGGQMLRWASEKIADPNLVTITSYSRMDETAWA